MRRILWCIAAVLAVAVIVASRWDQLQNWWTARQARLARAAADRRAAAEAEQRIRAFFKRCLSMPDEELVPGYAERKVRELGDTHFATREA
ncbi:MAG TPA: hypothetical protein VFA18_02680, partial [Gemmataceae bacterium]|nr:hypothetical protein [Gemmataceae bacterium]